MPSNTNTRLLERIANHYNRRIERDGSVRIPCPVHLGDDDNCSVREGKRADIIAFCHSHHCDPKQIVKIIRADIGADSTWKAAPISKPSESVKEEFPYYAHFKTRTACTRYCSIDIELVGGGFTEEHRHDYVDAAGKPKKLFKQVTGAGPSYLKILVKNAAENAVTICEGKKDALAVWDAGLNAAFWIGGAQSVQKQDFTPVQGKDIILWPDNDDSDVGQKAMEQVAFKCVAKNAASIRIVEDIPSYFADGDGAADCDDETIRSLIAGAVEWTAPADVQASSAVDMRPFEITSESFAARFIAKYADRLLSVETPEGQYDWYLADEESGVWRYNTDSDDFKLAFRKSVDDFYLNLLDRKDLTTPTFTKFTGYCLKKIEPRGYADFAERLGVARLSRQEDGLDKDLTTCKSEDLNPTGYLGSKNGVIDLRSGEMLKGNAARKKLVTLSLPDDFVPDAKDTNADALFAHLGDDVREYFLDALAYSLHGLVSRRFYAVVGDTAGGKTTMLQAVKSALGPQHGGVLSQDAITKPTFTQNKTGLNPEAGPLCENLFLYTDEVESLKIHSTFVKAITGGGFIPRRNPHGRLHEARPKATIFLNCNALPDFGLHDGAMLDRFKAIPIESIPAAQRDVDFAAKLDTKSVRQAIVAMLVRRAKGMTEPPADCDAVSARTEEAERSELGEVGMWLKAVVQPAQGKVLPVADLWQAAGVKFGEGDDGKVEHFTHQAFSRFARTKLQLPASRSVRVNGKNIRVYSGYELLSEDAIPEVAQPENQCRLCERSESKTTLVLLPKTGEFRCDYDNSDECSEIEKELFLASESLETRTLAANNPNAPAMQNGMDVVFTKDEHLEMAQYLDAVHWTLDWEVVNDVRVPIIPELTPDWQPETDIEGWALLGVTKLICRALRRHSRLLGLWDAKYNEHIAFLQSRQEGLLNFKFPFDAVDLKEGAAQPALSNGLADNELNEIVVRMLNAQAFAAQRESEVELPANNGSVQDPLTQRDA